MKVINSLIYCLLTVSSLACKRTDPLQDDSAIRYKYFNLEKAGWKSKAHNQKAEDINFTAIQVPVQYYILKDIGNEDLFKADSIYEANKTERIIEFEFLQEEEKDLLNEKFSNKTYKETIEYLSFTIEKDFYAVTSNSDTIACSGVLFERNYKVSPKQKILLFFSNIPPDEKIQLVYNDRLFGKGLLKFKFTENNTPISL
jgi:hypothetical protein